MPLAANRGDPRSINAILRTGKAHIDDLRAVRRRVIESLQDHKRSAFRAVLHALPKARIAKICAAGALPINRACDDDRAGDAGAVDMRTFLAAERIEESAIESGEFRMLDVDPGIDHGNRDIGAIGQLVRLRQSKFRHRILRGIALGQGRSFCSCST